MLLLLLYLFAFAQTQELSGNTSNVEIETSTEYTKINEVYNNSTTEIYPNVTTIYDISKILEVADNVTLEEDGQNTNKNNTSEVRVLASIDNDDNSTQIMLSKLPETINSLTSGDGENMTERNESEVPIKKVKVQFLYETGCPYSRRKYPEIEEVVKKLGPYIELTTYPFGNAHMTLHNSELSISCQHGERECYGNRLHACAIDLLKDPSVYVPFNSCMMLYRKRTISNDVSADACGSQRHIATEDIKSCAKGYRGFLLLAGYGIQSEKLDYPGVPWWIVNEVPEGRRKSLMETICAEIKKPPQVCESSSSEE